MGSGDENTFPRIQVSPSTLPEAFKMADLEISVVGENICAKLGEGPHWDTNTQKLLWVDAFGYSVHVLDVDTGKVKEIFSKLVALILRRVKFPSLPAP